jgi:hypothetical protein
MHHVIRWTCIVGAAAIALSSCDRGRAGAPAPSVAAEPSKTGAPAGGSDAPTGWGHVAALARSAEPPGKSEHLAAAIAIAARNEEAWSAVRRKNPPPPLAEYAEGAAAVAELEAWARDKGGLVPASPLPDPSVFNLFMLGDIATETATAAAHASLDATAYLGYRLLAEGRNMLEATLGTTLLQEAIDRAHQLGMPVAGWQLPTDRMLVRILAGDALYVKYTLSPEGKAEIEARIAKFPGKEKPLTAEAAGLEGETEALQKLWLVALESARSSDTDRATVERIKQAGAGNPLWAPVSRAVEELARNLERVRTSAAAPPQPPPGQ